MKVSRLTVVNLAIGVLLLASPFLVAISTSGLWPYDPWWDVNADGVIDIGDVARVSGAFGTFGDSSKNVTIAGRVNKLAYVLSLTPVQAYTTFSTPYILVDGYSKMTVSVMFGAQINSYRLYAGHVGAGTFKIDEVNDFAGFYLIKTYDIPNERIYFELYNGEATMKTLTIEVYQIA